MSIHFDLPDEPAASAPPEARGRARDEVRLLVASPSGVHHTVFSSLGAHLRPGDLLVVNTSGTLPAAVDAVLLEAVAGREVVRRAYDAAVARRYLWHELGDVSLLLRRSRRASTCRRRVRSSPATATTAMPKPTPVTIEATRLAVAVARPNAPPMYTGMQIAAGSQFRSVNARSEASHSTSVTAAAVTTGIAQTITLVTRAMPSDRSHSNDACPSPMNSTTSATRTPADPRPPRCAVLVMASLPP